MQGNFKLIVRYLEKPIQDLIQKGFSGLILGPRQVGKSTMMQKILVSQKEKTEYLLQKPAIRLALEADPNLLIEQMESNTKKKLVFIDEAQRVPHVFDSAQYLIDNKKAQFIFTGSSARKLRATGANLIPGRIKRFHMDPLLWGELGYIQGNTVSLLEMQNLSTSVSYSFETSLLHGTLPGMIALAPEDRVDFLRTYTEIYLEEEIRAEALIRRIGAFARFIELAASESGTSPNLTKLSLESGVSVTTIKQYYQILEDTLVIERIDPFLKNARKRILTMPRYYFFDLGVRNALARLPQDNSLLALQKGVLFEHAIILEIIRRIHLLNKNYKVYFWRTSAGAEVDCVIDTGTTVIPIEIKSSKRVTASELRGLKIFLDEYANLTKHGYVITMGDRPEKIAENITAIPWHHL